MQPADPDWPIQTIHYVVATVIAIGGAILGAAAALWRAARLAAGVEARLDASERRHDSSEADALAIKTDIAYLHEAMKGLATVRDVDRILKQLESISTRIDRLVDRRAD